MHGGAGTGLGSLIIGLLKDRLVKLASEIWAYKANATPVIFEKRALSSRSCHHEAVRFSFRAIEKRLKPVKYY